MADLDKLLDKTSRTFALAIPMLPEPTRRQVGIAYLLFRIADTFEDATHWQPEEKAQALRNFDRLLRADAGDDAEELTQRWLENPPVQHEGYLELLGKTPAVLGMLRAMPKKVQHSLRKHLRRTVDGMIRFAGRASVLAVRTVDELREYCYVVAGIVGELLTELFLQDRASLASVGPYLKKRARFFGEALQLTNILKDSAGDIEEGRAFLPDESSRPQVFAMAREDLDIAREYVLALESKKADDGILAFTAMPVLLAWKTLERVEAEGPGAKLTRAEVARLVATMHDTIARGDSLRPLLTSEFARA